MTVAVVLVERVAFQIGDEQIRISVVVVVSTRDAQAVPVSAESGLCRDIRERSVAVVSIEHVPRRLRLIESGQGRALNEEHIEPPVTVVIEKRHTGTELLRVIVAATAALDVMEADARRARDVGEPYLR